MESYPCALTMMSLLCILEPGQKKASVLFQEPRTCITFRWHQTLYLNVILQEDRKGFWHLLDTSYLTSASFNTVFTRYIQLPPPSISSSFSSIYTFSPSLFSSQLPSFLFPSLHIIGPTAQLPGRAAGSTSDTSQDKRVTPDCRGEGSHPWQRSAGFRLFMVGTNYRSARLARALETPVSTKKMQNWFRQKNTDWPLKLSPLEARQIKHGVM